MRCKSKECKLMLEIVEWNVTNVPRGCVIVVPPECMMVAYLYDMDTLSQGCSHTCISHSITEILYLMSPLKEFYTTHSRLPSVRLSNSSRQVFILRIVLPADLVARSVSPPWWGRCSPPTRSRRGGERTADTGLSQYKTSNWKSLWSVTFET